MAKSNSPILFLFLIINFTIPSTLTSQSLNCPMPPELSDHLRLDPLSLQSAATDYGNIIHNIPAAVLFPTSVQHISSLIGASYTCSTPFGVAARGNGHSTRGQAMVSDNNGGVVVDSRGLREFKSGGAGILISKSGLYADVGGEQLWSDVLNVCVGEGVSPISWTDFLGLTVGGTLSNGGISGQSFRMGPQITNVLEMDVVTGKGELVTCSPVNNSELFYGVLGGLGQFGVITRARIPLGHVLDRVLWIQILYSNFTAFILDQERFITLHGKEREHKISYLEGGILLDNGTPNTWKTSFFSPNNISQIESLIKKHGIIYNIEVASSYDTLTSKTISKQMDDFIKQLRSVPDFVSKKDVSYVEFMTRVPGVGVDENKEAHPWLNLFVPKSRVSDFDSGVLRDIVLARNITTGPILFYPLLRDKWDDRMSAVIPDEDIFYTVALLYSSEINDWEKYEDQNKAILDYCDKSGIKVKQYLKYHSTQDDWIQHFGSKWQTFKDRKTLFDPKFILSPGQHIFN
ncbi:cytokinin dehydrogenase 2-like [Euphorbia lathyris]|uniref:cytokinin dehydrogenase 2-like n=1 Tax=Euphorbia lathyris TaxID=212925 RepID=UPI0033134DDA